MFESIAAPAARSQGESLGAANVAFEAEVDLLLETVTATAKEIARLQARQLTAVAAIAALRPPSSLFTDGGAAVRDDGHCQTSEFVGDEVAAALCMSPASGRNLVHLALTVTSRLPASLEALGRGDLDLVRLRVLSEETAELPSAECGQVESQVLDRAPGQTPGQLRRSTRRAVLRVDPRSAAERHNTARAQRLLTLTPLPDGMAELRAITTATVADGLWSAVDRMARTPVSAGDDRTLDARRVDALAEAVLGPDMSGLRAEIRVLVPVTTLLGADDEPGELEGYGPLAATQVREIAFTPGSRWRRLLTDPASDTVLAVGTRSYEPPAPLARFVRARDRTCRFPGCLRRAETSDLDHTVEYPRGPTSADNLVVLCRHHHRLKHATSWAYRQVPGGVEWTSPAGRGYVVSGEHTESQVRLRR